ncbi:hypothetical protein [Natronorubrum sp. FCH18a]|uniref:hypothetical protein n=1 Tax=Natronorubrum sp. FCH18a TaxID=3447018 RepID=UPI003F50ECFE
MHGAIDFDAVCRRAEEAETDAVREFRLVAETRAVAGLTDDVGPVDGDLIVAGETEEGDR